MVKMVNFMLYILLWNKNNWGGESQDSWSMPMPRYRSLPIVDTVLPPEQASPQALTAVWTLYNRIPEWRQITTTTHNRLYGTQLQISQISYWMKWTRPQRNTPEKFIEKRLAFSSVVVILLLFPWVGPGVF